MEIWLKETVIGIIILGGIGSALAALALYLLKKGLKFIAPKAYEASIQLVANVILYMIEPAISAQTKLFINKDPNKTNAYFSMLKAQYIMYMFITTWLVFWLIIRVKFDQISFSSIESIIYIAIIIFMLVLAVRKFACLIAPWVYNIDGMIEKSLKEHAEKS